MSLPSFNSLEDYCQAVDNFFNKRHRPKEYDRSKPAVCMFKSKKVQRGIAEQLASKHPEMAFWIRMEDPGKWEIRWADKVNGVHESRH